MRPLSPLGLALTLLATAPLAAQCGLHYLPGELPGADAIVRTVATWDPDGPGPAAARLVAGGLFHAVGPTPCELLASRDPVTGQWAPLGTGVLGDHVRALLPLPNGDLIVGGEFRCPGVPGAFHVARWDGQAWHGLGGGVAGPVHDLALAPNGDVLVVGDFQQASGVPADGVARWDGSSWHALGSGAPGSYAVEVLPSGDVVVGGAFTTAGGVPAANIARWDGSAWSPLGAGIGAGSASITPYVSDLDLLPNGELVVAGHFYAAGNTSARGVARWDGQAWHPVGSVSARVYAVHALANGDLAACVETLAGVILWDRAAASWTGIGGLSQQYPYRAYTVTDLPGGDLVVGGSFKAFAGVPAFNLARWDGTGWSALAPGQPPDLPIEDLLLAPDGDVLARGAFTSIGGVPADGIARWDGSGWAAMGSPSPAFFLSDGWVARANGDVILSGFVSGDFGLIRWDGSTWSRFTQLSGPVNALVELPNGELIAGGSFMLPGGPSCKLARWDGTSWSVFAGNVDDRISRLWLLRNGDLVAGGWFTTIGGVAAPGLARWDGATWTPIGSTPATWRCLVELPNGDLAVGVDGPTGTPLARGVARWDGTSWTRLGAGLVGTIHSLVQLPGGDLIAGGPLVLANGTAYPNGIARWDGASWDLVGPGFGGGTTSAMVLRPNGELCFGGSFTTAGGFGAAHFARLAPDCPAAATAYGAGCAGSAGPMDLAADGLPWIGTTFRATSSGIAGNGLAFALTGFTPTSVPLSQWHPGSPPTCTLLVDPLASEWLPASAGQATLTLNVPNDPSFVGVQLLHQIVQAELGPGPRVRSLTSSNGLQTTVGAL